MSLTLIKKQKTVFFFFILFVFSLANSTLAKEKELKWYISPKNDKGFLKNVKNEKDLIKIFGSKNVKREMHYSYSWQEKILTTVLFPNDSTKKIIIFWKKRFKYKSLEELRFSGKKSVWKIPYGITLGDSLKKLESINRGTFDVCSIDGDGYGLIFSWTNGKLEKEFNENIFVTLENFGEMRTLENLTFGNKITKETTNSSNKNLQKINPRIKEIMIRFK